MSTIRSAKQLDRSVAAGITRTAKWRELVEQELKEVPSRIYKETGGQLRLKCGEQVNMSLLNQLAKHGYQRRAMKMLVERQLVRPLLRLIFTGQIRENESLSVEVSDSGDEFYFSRPQVYQSNKRALL